VSRLHTPTPGERLLYALRQLHRQRRGHAASTPPDEVDVEAVAKALGIWGEVEFVQEVEGDGEPSRHLHFAGEVLVVDHRCGFPWQLLDVWEWARRQEAREFWRYLD
jgi:hypothetical protein